MNRLGVFLIDDHGVLRHGLRMLIDSQADMHVVGEAERGRGVSALLDNTTADVVVLDISMPDISGVQVAAEIRGSHPNVKIVALSRHAEKAYVQQMLEAGAMGYVRKQTEAAVLLAAIRAVAGGEKYLDPSIAGKLFETHGSRTAKKDVGGLHALTPREREIVTLVAYGHTNKEIAGSLGITVKTVETHKTNIMQKLELTSRADVVRFALSQGWLEKSS